MIPKIELNRFCVPFKLFKHNKVSNFNKLLQKQISNFAAVNLIEIHSSQKIIIKRRKKFTKKTQKRVAKVIYQKKKHLVIELRKTFSNTHIFVLFFSGGYKNKILV
jgi:hypothetical protein